MDTNRTDHIRSRAYEIWEAAGRPHGHDLAHWLQAEAELAESKAPPSVKHDRSSKPAARRTTEARAGKGAGTRSR